MPEINSTLKSILKGTNKIIISKNSTLPTIKVYDATATQACVACALCFGLNIKTNKYIPFFLDTPKHRCYTELALIISNVVLHCMDYSPETNQEDGIVIVIDNI